MRIPPPLRPIQLAVILPCAALAVLVASCRTSPGPGYAARRSTTVVVANDDYLYYPGYEAYYSNTRHNYVYRDRDRWVTRAEPPRGWVQGGVSVHMDWHDSPERHHNDVVRSYPKTWRPKVETRPAPEHRDNDRKDRDDHRP